MTEKALASAQSTYSYDETLNAQANQLLYRKMTDICLAMEWDMLQTEERHQQLQKQNLKLAAVTETLRNTTLKAEEEHDNTNHFFVRDHTGKALVMHASKNQQSVR